MREPLQVLDLFSGLGGFTLAAERIRQSDGNRAFQTVAFCEIDKFARKVLAKHWSEVPCFENVQELTTQSLRERGIGRVDVLTGGWPCQGNSIAGKRGGHGDERSGLFSEILRLIDGLDPRPRFLCLENVPGLVSVSGGGDFRDCLTELRRRGYAGCVRRLDARYFGLAQRRQRLFFVFGLGAAGIRAVLLVTEGGTRYPAPGREAEPRSATAVTIGTLQSSGGNGRGYRIGADEAAAGHLVPMCARARKSPRTGQRYDGESETFIVEDVLAFNWQAGGSVDRTAPRAESTSALGATQTPAVASSHSVRRLSPSECEILQGVPVGHTCLCERNDGRSWHPDGPEYACRCADGNRYRILGNGLALPCAEWVLGCVATAHFYEEQMNGN